MVIHINDKGLPVGSPLSLIMCSCRYSNSLLKIVNEYPIMAVIVVLAERPKSSAFELPNMSDRP